MRHNVNERQKRQSITALRRSHDDTHMRFVQYMYVQ